jgi:phosphoribosylglycinamide formyltransferase-1
MSESLTEFNLAVFASGNGSNAENIALYFKEHPHIHLKLILTNNPQAGVIQRAHKLGIDIHVFNRMEFNNTQLTELLQKHRIDLIVLAGFLWKIPQHMLAAFPDKIINIHPALLPKYGGKGMYGDKVHESVKKNGEKESGISIHFVNEQYDEGQIIFQQSCSIDAEKDSIDVIAQKVHELEYTHYPRIIEQLLLSKET